MKKFVLFIVCLCIVAGTAFAQQFGGTPEEMAQRTTDRMKTELNLNADQVTKVQEINLSIAKERTKMMENAAGDFESMRGEMEKLNAKTLAEYEKVLTKEQLTEYNKLQEQRRPQTQAVGTRRQ